ncbi:C-factor [Thalassocella blandensis]|nr:C-factor [Thalassocella blandensis]
MSEGKQCVVITGANRGIGLALVKEYLARNCDVIAVCRTPSEALLATSARLVQNIDVSQEASVEQLVSELAQQKIDVLINNAGILRNEALGEIEYATVLEQLQVNAVAPLRVTEALLNNLAAGAKVAMITSRMGSISDNGSGGYYGYRMSKAALNAAAMSLSKDLQPKGISVAILHPGFVQTDMVGHAGDISAEDAAARLVQRIDGVNLQNSGTFWHSNGEVLPW